MESKVEIVAWNKILCEDITLYPQYNIFFLKPNTALLL